MYKEKILEVIKERKPTLYDSFDEDDKEYALYCAIAYTIHENIIERVIEDVLKRQFGKRFTESVRESEK